jgi:hypothetical protein
MASYFPRWHHSARDTSVGSNHYPRLLRLTTTLSQSSRQYLIGDYEGILVLGIISIRYDLANRRNASRRSSQLPSDCAVILYTGVRISVSPLGLHLGWSVTRRTDFYHTWLHQIMIYMKITTSQAPLSIPQTQYERPGVGRIDYKQAG